MNSIGHQAQKQSPWQPIRKLMRAEPLVQEVFLSHFLFRKTWMFLNTDTQEGRREDKKRWMVKWMNGFPRILLCFCVDEYWWLCTLIGWKNFLNQRLRALPRGVMHAGKRSELSVMSFCFLPPPMSDEDLLTQREAGVTRFSLQIRCSRHVCSFIVTRVHGLAPPTWDPHWEQRTLKVSYKPNSFITFLHFPPLTRQPAEQRVAVRLRTVWRDDVSQATRNSVQLLLYIVQCLRPLAYN